MSGSEQETAQERAERSAEVMWAGDAASRALGMSLDQVSPGRAVVSMTVRPDMVNGWDVAHGGLIASLADSAFAVACNSHGQVTVAAGFDITFLESGRLGDVLVATAEERALRGRSGLYDVTVVRSDATGGTKGDATGGTEGGTKGGTVVAELRGRSRALGRPIGG